MKKFITAFLVLTLAFVFGCNAFALEYAQEWDKYTSVSTVSFSDVQDHWAKEEIARVVEKGWFNGYPDGTFHPNATITRSEAMTVFVKFLGIQPKVVDESSYTDVKLTDWFSPYIEAGKKLFPEIEVFNGELPFNPNQPITRETTIYALVTALRYTDDTRFADQSILNMFKDQSSISYLVKPYAAVAVDMGLVSGYPDGSIGGQDPLTRAEFAAMLYRATFFGTNG